MTIYVITGRYTSRAMRGMLARPEDREAEVRGLFERTGGRMLGYYIMFGDCDWMVIAENSSEIGIMSALAIAGASGSVSDVKTTVATTSAQAKQAYERAQKSAGSFSAAGGGSLEASSDVKTHVGYFSDHMLANEG